MSILMVISSDYTLTDIYDLVPTKELAMESMS